MPRRSFLPDLEDFLLMIGALLIIIATGILNLVAAIYVAGVVCLVFGFLIGYGNRRNGGNSDHP